jgi:hypothetical protein
LTPVLVSQFSVDIVFPKIAHYLQPAIEHNRCSEWTLDAVYSECVAGRMLLFVDDQINPKNALVARFATWGGERVFYIAFMGGEGGENWADVFQHIKSFALRYGVARVTANLRDGWMKFLKVKKLATLCEIED